MVRDIRVTLFVEARDLFGEVPSNITCSRQRICKLIRGPSRSVESLPHCRHSRIIALPFNASCIVSEPYIR